GQQVPEMTDEVVAGISARYQELYENIVGKKFVPADDSEDLLARIERNVTEYLK
ncbi:MAG: phosphoribosylaminoimidazolesuccinocarboxamide synthase, partial [Paludibacteraceae bacterium]|nr:phosphoribosylaminoimidazolesuccinocarboxamide synthase [Paludibacteraceae bacterium]